MRKIKQPQVRTIWPVSRQHWYCNESLEECITWFLELYAARDYPMARKVWDSYQEKFQDCIPIIDKFYSGRWDLYPASVCIRYLATNSDRSKEELAWYCRQQLDEANLWGRELLSLHHILHIPALMLARQALHRRREEVLYDLVTATLRAYVILWSLCAVNAKESGGVSRLTVLGPSMNVAPEGSPRDPASSALSAVLARRPRVIDPERIEYMPQRVACVASQRLFRLEEIDLLRGHIESGSNAEAMAGFANKACVTTRVPILVYRYLTGEYICYAAATCMDRPILGGVLTDGKIRNIFLHQKSETVGVGSTGIVTEKEKALLVSEYAGVRIGREKKTVREEIEVPKGEAGLMVVKQDGVFCEGKREI